MDFTNMERRGSYQKYLSLFGISARDSFMRRGEAYGKAFFLVALLLVFSALWKTVFASREGFAGLGAADMIWYLTLTEWTLIATPFIHLEMQREIHSGDVACRLPRPMSYLLAKIADGLGKIAVRAFILALVGAAAAWLLAGELPSNPVGLLYALPLGLLASFVDMLGLIAIGLLAIWIIDVMPIYMVWQKLSFVLGGLIFPLDIYPDWLVQICKCTPFYAYLYGVGRLAYMNDPMVALETLGLLVFWGVMLFGVCVLLQKRGLRRLTISGG